MILPITLTIAGAAAILHVWLEPAGQPAAAAAQDRRRRRRQRGAAAADARARQFRREHADLPDPARPARAGDRRQPAGSGAPAIVFILARIAPRLRHGPARRANLLRVGGMIGSSWLVLLGLAGWALTTPISARRSHSGIEIATGPDRFGRRPDASVKGQPTFSAGLRNAAARRSAAPTTIDRLTQDSDQRRRSPYSDSRATWHDHAAITRN